MLRGTTTFLHKSLYTVLGILIGITLISNARQSTEPAPVASLERQISISSQTTTDALHPKKSTPPHLVTHKAQPQTQDLTGSTKERDLGKTSETAGAEVLAQNSPTKSSSKTSDKTTDLKLSARPIPDNAKSYPSVLPQAKSVKLGEPIKETIKGAAAFDTVSEANTAKRSDNEDNAVESSETEDDANTIILLGTKVPAATSTRLAWSPEHSFEGVANPTPVLVVNGAKPGPALCLTAAIHGDELNGIEIVRRVLYDINPKKLSGTVIGVPIVNLQGFQRTSRYLPDRRDLNRYFPGNENGSSASRIAHSFFNEVIKHCSALVDLHTGSFNRTNLPQLRADLSNPGVVDITKGFGATVVLQSDGTKGTLRRAAVDYGIPAVTLEAGGPMQLQEDAVKHSVKGIRTLLNHLDMVKKIRLWGDPEPIYYNSAWLRADTGGILFSEVKLGKRVDKGDFLGSITNPITNVRSNLYSKYDGRVIGMALNQVVMPGFAAFHIGIRASDEDISELRPLQHVADSSQADEILKDALQRSNPSSMDTSELDKNASSKAIDVALDDIETNQREQELDYN